MKRIIFAILAIPMLLVGCGQKTNSSNTSTTNVSWVTVPSNEQQAILKVSKRYGDSQPLVVRVVQSLTEADQKPMYVVFLSGHFHYGDIQSNSLSFSILADGSQTWAVSLNQNSELPSWMSISSSDVSSISVQGWGPGADGNFMVYPPIGQSASLIHSLVAQLPKDRVIKPHVTATSQGGADWLVVKLKNGTTIQLASFPNDPTPMQYHVTLTNKSGKQEKSAMISDDSGIVTSTIHEISSNGIMVGQKKH